MRIAAILVYENSMSLYNHKLVIVKCIFHLIIEKGMCNIYGILYRASVRSVLTKKSTKSSHLFVNIVYK